MNLRAFSIGGDIRVVYRELDQDTVEFLDIGTQYKTKRALGWWGSELKPQKGRVDPMGRSPKSAALALGTSLSVPLSTVLL